MQQPPPPYYGRPQPPREPASYLPPFSAPPAAPFGRSSVSHAPYFPGQPQPGSAAAPYDAFPQQPYGSRAMPPARMRSQPLPAAPLYPLPFAPLPRPQPRASSAGPALMAARPGSPLFPPSAFTAAAPPRAPLRPVSPILAAAAAREADAREAKLKPAWLGSRSGSHSGSAPPTRGGSPVRGGGGVAPPSAYAPTAADDPFDFEGGGGAKPRRVRSSVNWDDIPPGGR